MRTMTLTLVLLLLAGTALAESLGTSAGHDLDDLWKQAQKNYDLDSEDAVLLLESRHVTVSDDGALATRVHRVVWIGTSRGIREYADLRVPWNSATSTLDVEILRTWMDGRWWPDAQQIGETAVVHTLPYAVDHADDYTSMRETMLLHDGVELPCIMETAYTIAEQGSPAAGADGLFVVPQRDPAVLTEYVVRMPVDATVHTSMLNGAPAPAEDEGSGVRSLTWRVEGAADLARPHTGHPERYEPAVAWSTWQDWADLAGGWSQAFDAAAVVGDALGDSLDVRLRPVIGPRDQVRAVVDFVDENVRTVRYDTGYWRLSPRSADRVWDTGYGHVLDKAVLTAALLRRSGATVTPVFVGEPGPDPLADVPAFVSLGRFMLHVTFGDDLVWNNLPHLVDPAHGSVQTEAALQGHPRFWFGENPRHQAGSVEASAYMLSFALVPGAEGGWTGTVAFDADFLFNYRDNAGDEGLAARLDAVVGSVLPGATVAAVRPQVVTTSATSTIAEVTIPADEEDQVRLVVGRPAGGLLDGLPGDVHLHDAERESPVLLGTLRQQMVVVRLKLEGREVLRRPADQVLTNEAGTFTVRISVDGGWLQVMRSIELEDTIDGGLWPDLRALLLEEADAANATIILE